MVTQPNLSLIPNVREVYFGFVKHPAKSTLGPRIQRGVEFIYVLTGKVDIIVDGQQHILMPGHMALQLPQREELFFFHNTQQTEHSWCQLDFHEYPNELIEHLVSLPCILPVTQEIEQLMELGLSITNTQMVNNQQILYRLGEALLQYYQEIAKLEKSARPHPTSRAVRCATNYIQQHYSSNIKLDDLAAASYCSINNLINQFKASFHMTPMRYLWQFRLDRSEGLLRHTNLPIAVISEQCGFASPFHFSRLFKQRHQLSPSQYRQKNNSTV